MTVRELYKLLQDRFPESKGGLNLLAWPLHQPNLGVQYVDADGQRLGNAIVNPVSILFAEPLGGPFYDLPVVGLTPLKSGYNKRHGKWKYVSLVVKNGDELALSSSVSLLIKMPTLKGLASDLGIDWYCVTRDWPMTFTRLSKFDDCVVYEQPKTDESSL